MKRLAGALLCLSSLSVSACGFSPMYSTGSLATDGSIEIPEIEGYAGHVMRRELIMLLRAGVPGVESGVLKIKYEEESRDFAFQPTGANSRTETRNTAQYRLRTPSGDIRGMVTGAASFAAPSAPYADITSRREASAKAATDAAQLLVEDILLKAGSLQGKTAPAQK